MVIGICGNQHSRGLDKDCKLITPILESLGHQTAFIQFDEPHSEKYELVLCLEVVARNLVRLSEMPPILLCNPEWLTPESIKAIKRFYGAVLCKTKEAHRICSTLFGEKARYVGFISEDKFDPTIERKMTFLHVAGSSAAKGTNAIIDAWRWKKDGKALDAKLTVVSDFPQEDLPENVTLLSKIGDEELKRLQNENQFHLQPSQTEGFSHVLHEALSVNGTILTVDAPPMNEIDTAYRIPSCGSTLFNSVRMYDVSALDVYDAVESLQDLGRRGFAEMLMPRKEFLAGNEAFKTAFAEQLKDLGTIPWVGDHWQAPARTNEKCIAFIGNFAAEHSTENQILWALEQGLGYEVEKLQENEVTLEQIRDACDYCHILMWVRTPNWLKVPDEEMFALLDELKHRGVRTVGVHLDKFWGIPEREFLIGRIPFWKVEYCFTADGSRQEDFAARGVNHFWMRPAVSEVYCHPGTPREEYRCDVGFVGAKEYHSEYPFRRQMVEFLEETYGDRFKHVQGVRGHLLNDVYASMRVVVGDCFQAGTPRYCSDRLMETTGRFGFLLHPEIEGLRLPVATYKPQDLEDLQDMIDYWLSDDSGRRMVTVDCAERVKLSDTWTVRCREILEVVNGEKNHATSAD